MVVWQIPMGNTLMRATNDTWGHYADNRPEWFLDDVTDGNLASWRDDGVIALLFGGGAGGTTCACDGVGDGTTNPPASGTHTRASLSADDDGGYLRDRVAAYYVGGRPVARRRRHHAAPSASAAARRRRPRPRSSTSRRRPPPRPSPSTAGTTSRSPPACARRCRGQVLVDVEIYGPKGARVKQRTWTVSLAAGATRTLSFTWHIGAHRKLGPVHDQDRRVRARVGRAPALEQQGDDLQRSLTRPRPVAAISRAVTTRLPAAEAVACGSPVAAAGPARAA